MRQDAGAAVHLAVADRSQANGANAVKQALAHAEVVDVRRRRPLHPHVDVAGVVHAPAEAGMGFQPASVGQVDGPRSDVVDRGAAFGIERHARALRHLQGGKPDFPCGTGGRWRSGRRNLRRRAADGGMRRGTRLRNPAMASGRCCARCPCAQASRGPWPERRRSRRPRLQSAGRRHPASARTENARSKETGGCPNGKRSSKDACRWSDAVGSDRHAVSWTADTNGTMPRLATRTREPSSCDGRASPNAPPATSAAIPAGIERIPTLTKKPPCAVPLAGGSPAHRVPQFQPQKAEHCGKTRQEAVLVTARATDTGLPGDDQSGSRSPGIGRRPRTASRCQVAAAVADRDTARTGQRERSRRAP